MTRPAAALGPVLRRAGVLVAASALALAVLAVATPAYAQCPTGGFSATIGATYCSEGYCLVPVSWTPPSGSGTWTQYQVHLAYWNGSGWCGAAGSDLLYGPTSLNSYTLASVQLNRVFTVWVTVVGCPGVVSGAVASDTLLSPAGVPSLSGTLSGQGAVTLAFTPPDTRSPGHQIQRGPNPSSFVTLATYGPAVYCPAGTQKTYFDSGLSPGTYYYRIQTLPSYAGSGGASNVVQVTVPAPPAITAFSANPGSIPLGQSTTLTWTTANATSASISGVGSVPLSGNVVVSPQQTTTYTLTATGPGGTTTSQVTVTVTAAGTPQIQSFSAVPSSIAAGQQATLSWTSTGGTQASIDHGVGTVPTNGSTVVSPSQTTTYTLTVTGPGGTATRTALVTVTSSGPQIQSFTATPSTVAAGQVATLAWTSTGGIGASIDNGVGSVPTSGSTVVSPQQTTTYTLTVAGPPETSPASRAVTVTVTPAMPQIQSFVASPGTVVAGGSSQLSWASTGGTQASIDNGVGSVPTSGSTVVTPQQTTTYTLTVNGPGGTATRSVAVGVGAQGLALEPPALSLARGTSGTATVRLNPTRAVATTVALAASDPSVATPPPSVTVAAYAETATFAVSALGIGSTTVTATLPPEAGAGTATMAVDVTCGKPPSPSPWGPSGFLPTGAVFNVAWNDVSGAEPVSAYDVELAESSGFATLLESRRTAALSAAFLVPPVAGDLLFVRVRGFSTCGIFGLWSDPLAIRRGRAPATVIVSDAQAPVWAVARLAAVPSGTVKVRNVGEASTAVTLAASGGFFTASPSSATLAPGQELTVALAASAGAAAGSGFFQGAVTAAWASGTAVAPVTLTVADALADVGLEVDRDTVFNLEAGGGVFTEELRVTNPGDVPVAVAATIGPGGGWLGLEPLDVLAPIAPKATRTVRLRIDRSKRTAADGAPPLLALLDLRSAGGTTGRLVRVYDAEPGTPREAAERTPPDPVRPSFVIPTAVHAGGAAGALFISDGWVRNLSPLPVVVELLATPRGGGASLVVEETLPGLALVRLYDFIQLAFGRTDLAANVEIRPKDLGDAAQLVVRTTTEGLPAGGQSLQRFASEVPVYASRTGTGAGLPALLMTGVELTETVRTNVILSETAGAPAGVTLRLHDSAGRLVAGSARPIEVPAFGVVQDSLQGILELPAGTRVEAASLRIEGVSGAGRVVALGTAIDNVSQSFRALTVSRVAQAEGAARAAARTLSAVEVKPVVIPSIVRAKGINAFFTSTLHVTNETAQPASLTFVYAYSGTDGAGSPVSGTKSVERTIPARGSLEAQRAKDIVVNLLELPAEWQTNGPLRIEGPGVGQVIVRSWVQTPADVARPDQNLKYAEFVGFSAASPETVGAATGSGIVLSSGVSRMASQRTNLILTEVAGGAAQVRVLLQDGSTGLTLGGTADLALGPYEKRQINDADLWAQLGLGTGERAGLQLVLQAVGSGPGRVAGVLTTIDNATNATLVTPFAPAGPQAPAIGVGR